MRDIWLVIKHDVGTTLRQKSFWLMTFLMPTLLLALNIYSVVLDNEPNGGNGVGSATEETRDSGPSFELPIIGIVDEGGLIVEIPDELPPDLFVRFANERAALSALEQGEVDQYVFVPADYVASGEVTVYDENFLVREDGEGMGVAFGTSQGWMLTHLINTNLANDEHLAVVLSNPTPGSLTEHHVINPLSEEAEGEEALANVVASITPYIYYFLLLIGSSYLMRSVVAEKENRTVEVLLVSLNPRRLMAGKIAAMGAVTLLQLAVWVGGGILVMNRGADLLNVSAFTFPPLFFLWALLFLLSGFLLFAAAMTAAGAIANNAREGGQMTWLLIVPLMPTLLFSDQFLNDPNGTLSVALSLFPFSAPSAMVTRLAVATVPLWQILVSLAGLTLTSYLMLIVAARFFRPGNLLSQASFNWRRLATGWRS